MIEILNQHTEAFTNIQYQLAFLPNGSYRITQYDRDANKYIETTQAFGYATAKAHFDKLVQQA
jgi:hypothetical protein